MSQSEPSHALRAERERGGDLAAAADAAGREHRRGRDRVDDLGDEHHRRDLAGVAAGLVALGDDHVDAVVHVALRVLGLAGERGDLHAVLVRLVDHVLGRRAERVRDQRDRMRERDLDVAVRDVVGPTEHAVPGSSPSGSGGRSKRSISSST